MRTDEVHQGPEERMGPSCRPAELVQDGREDPLQRVVPVEDRTSGQAVPHGAGVPHHPEAEEAV